MNHPEQDFEQRCVAEARRQGWTCWKNEHNGLKATKIIIPSEMQGLVGLANGIVEGVKGE